MTNLIKQLLFYSCSLLFILGSVSCECTSRDFGVVIEKETNKPLSGVAITIYLSQIHKDSLLHPVLTDKNGHFELMHNYCSDYMLDFYKEGYISFVRSMPQGNTIFLEKTKEYEQN